MESDAQQKYYLQASNPMIMWSPLSWGMADQPFIIGSTGLKQEVPV